MAVQLAINVASDYDAMRMVANVAGLGLSVAAD